MTYESHVSALYGWFLGRTARLDPIEISEDQFSRGIDALPESHRDISVEAVSTWVVLHHYEPSYNQLCRAMMFALLDAGKLTGPAAESRLRKQEAKP